MTFSFGSWPIVPILPFRPGALGFRGQLQHEPPPEPSPADPSPDVIYEPGKAQRGEALTYAPPGRRSRGSGGACGPADGEADGTPVPRGRA